MRCVLEAGKLKSLSGGIHNHPAHSEKIEKMLEKARLSGTQDREILMTDIKMSPTNSLSGRDTPLTRSENAGSEENTIVELLKTKTSLRSHRTSHLSHPRMQIIQNPLL